MYQQLRPHLPVALAVIAVCVLGVHLRVPFSDAEVRVFSFFANQLLTFFWLLLLKKLS